MNEKFEADLLFALVSSFSLFYIHILFIFFITWLYLGQMWTTEALQVTPGGPDTYDDPHKTVPARTACKTLFYPDKLFRKLLKAFKFLMCISITSFT